MKTHSLVNLEKDGYKIDANIIEKIDVNIIAHFSNIPCLTIRCKDITPYGYYNDIARIGFLIRELVELFEVGREDGVMLSELTNIPCRIVYSNTSKSPWEYKAVGIGHSQNDKFILFSDFAEFNQSVDKANG